MTDLYHTIETNIEQAAAARDLMIAMAICEEIKREHGGSVKVNDDCSFLRINARCNGAALRDLITKLDCAGYLN